MKYFLPPLIAGLLLVAALNLYVDPAGQWWPLNYNFSKNWDKDEAWVAPLRIEERQLRIRQIELMPKVDVLAIGSSRLLNTDQGMLPKGTKFYNLSVSGATVWDYVGLWEECKRQGKIPKHLLLYVDTWNFNKNTWQKYRWIANADLVMQFLFQNGSANLEMSAIGDWLAGSFYRITDLLSPATLKTSLQEFMLRRKQGALDTNYIANISERPALLPAWKNDGSYLYPQDNETPKTLEQITEIGRNTGQGGMYVYMKDWETDRSAIRLLDYLLRDMEKYGVDVLLVQPPFQHEAYKIIMDDTEYKSIPAQYGEAIALLQTKHPKLSYCNSIDPALIPCDPTEFMDSAHMLKSCAKKLMQRCLAQKPEWFSRRKH